MRKILFALTLLATTAAFISCKDKEKDNFVERIIMYSVDGKEECTTLTSDAEWDELVDLFCNYAQEGKTVKFYNRSTQSYTSHKGTWSMKEVTTFSTTDREKMKQWMMEMEKDGKTVNVTYDNKTGKWNGTAYDTAPNPVVTDDDCYDGILVMAAFPISYTPPITSNVVALQTYNGDLLLLAKNGFMSTDIASILPDNQLGDSVTLCGDIAAFETQNGDTATILDISNIDEGSIVGLWQFDYLAVTTLGSGDQLLSTDIYAPLPGEATLFNFASDGSVSAIHNHADGNTETENGTWSISDDGTICCNIFAANGGCWYINWLTANTMIITKSETGTDDSLIFYQMQFQSSKKYLVK